MMMIKYLGNSYGLQQLKSEDISFVCENIKKNMLKNKINEIAFNIMQK